MGTSHNSRVSLAFGLAIASAVLWVPETATASALDVDLCVGAGSKCYPTIQGAVDAARNGDTIKVAAGTFAGGVTITKSLRVIGAGQGKTVIRGGEPVLTIGDVNAAASDEPSVGMEQLTVTDGLATGDGVVMTGGGILIPSAIGGSLGATVSLSHVTVSGNRADATATSPSPSGAPCPGGDCPFALSAGGGIANFGTLSLDHSRVSDNRAAGVASDVNGGGIFSAGGALTLTDSVVSGNAAIASIPNGRFAEGGGLFVNSGGLTIRDSLISRNTASLASNLPAFAGDELIEMVANGAGVHIGDNVVTVVDRTKITRNFLSATDPVGEPIAFDAGMIIGDSPLTMTDTVISQNNETVNVATDTEVGASGTAFEVDGPATISRTKIVDNSVVAHSPNGVAGATSGFSVFDGDGVPEPVVMTDSIISGNTAKAFSAHGTAEIQGAGILNTSLLELRNVVVSDNVGRAVGARTIAHGGGIWSGVFFSGPRVELVLHDTLVTKNLLIASDPTTVQGAGVYTTEAITRDHAVIARNTPDQCVGCDLVAAAAR
jgi:hypothetical protein